MSGRKWLTSTDTIEFEVRDRCARIALNRPDKRNSLSRHMIAEINLALKEADDRTDVNVILIEGRGKDFCAGYDLMGVYGGGGDPDSYEAGLYRTNAGTMDDDSWQLERTQDNLMFAFDAHKPVVAKVHGNCLAGGTDLALGCDIVVAADDAKIGFPATRANGNPPNHWWVYHCGPQWAKRLLFTGDTVTGDTAAKLGLVLDAVPADELDAYVDHLLHRIGLVDSELLSTHKRTVNFALELAGARTLQRFSAELDARAHLSQGPRRSQFKKDMAEQGLKAALKGRDGDFGDSVVELRSRGR
ncbi:enoyl-CoA hydratase [Sphingobium sp. C100]|uniref:crotonase/enoyl-CoA hydratase family protein n=1 Tax=Sphingobium sp. C100 TaxID=1207055 RepID=UPI0003D5F9DC|nr:crotonase/enoyl-CoA hydratase family protein [Sphingobium sp. C100]ETI64258.1 enoyl-CoA hydratase [Sphingobium sp. C100]